MCIRDPPEQLNLSLYCDADFGGDIKSMRSTSGFILAVAGPSSIAPVSWSSKRQSVVARSTTESEFVSLSSALFSEAIPTLEVWQALIPGMTLKVFEDNTAVVSIIQKGYSNKLRHLSKTHRINVASTAETVNNADDITVQHIETTQQKGDVFTKGLPLSKWGNALELLQFSLSPLPSYDAGRSSHD